jgi:ABC-type branched-subunit amino acid transport system substrate-binding protein
MNAPTTFGHQPIKLGVITDQTGPLSVMGIANANVAKMVIADINANGGLLGRQLELYLEDSETTDSVGEPKPPSSSSKTTSMSSSAASTAP